MIDYSQNESNVFKQSKYGAKTDTTSGKRSGKWGRKTVHQHNANLYTSLGSTMRFIVQNEAIPGEGIR